MKLITSRALNDTSFVELREKLDMFAQQLHDYRDTIWDRARQDTVFADKVAIIVAKRVDRFNSVKANITALFAKATELLSEAANEVSTAKAEKILTIFDNSMVKFYFYFFKPKRYSMKLNLLEKKSLLI